MNQFKTINNNITKKETVPLLTIEETNSILLSHKSLNILHTNIRSISKHISELECLNTSLNNDNHIIITTESWLNDNFNDNFLPFKNYQIESTNNNIRISDGIIILIKNEINQISTEINITNANCILTLVTYDKINYGIISIYRSPSGNIIKFIEDLDIVINNVINSHKNTTFILIGDFNIDILDTTNSTAIYLDLLNSLNFIQLINRPTRPQSNTCIDHIFVRDNLKHHNIKSAVIDSLITDHYPIILILYNKIELGKKNIKQTSYRFVDYNKLTSLSDKTNWNEIKLSQTTEDKITLLTTIIQNNLKKCTCIRHNKKQIKHWITPGIIQSINKRDKLHTLTRHQPFQYRPN